MRLEHLHVVLLVVASVLTGWIGWSGHIFLVPVAVAFPILWSFAETRWQAGLVAAAYFLAASRGLPLGVANFYRQDIWPGILLWLIASSAFVISYTVAWTDQHGWRKLAHYLIASVAIAVPPLVITGWAHPLTAAGVIFPGWGWWGLAAMAAGLGVMTTRHRQTAAVIMIGLWLWSAAQWTNPIQIASLIGVDLEMGASLGRDFSLTRQHDLIEITRHQQPGTTVVLPESTLGFWTPTIARFWQSKLADTEIKVIAGATIINEVGYDNVLVHISSNSSEIVYRERMPVPVSMWQPWFRSSDGARAHFFANPVVDIDGLKIGPLICYELLLIWPVLQSVLHGPDVIIAVGNGWWTKGTSIPEVQRASAAAWARLFNLPLVLSFNT